MSEQRLFPYIALTDWFLVRVRIIEKIDGYIRHVLVCPHENLAPKGRIFCGNMWK